MRPGRRPRREPGPEPNRNGLVPGQVLPFEVSTWHLNPDKLAVAIQHFWERRFKLVLMVTYSTSSRSSGTIIICGENPTREHLTPWLVPHTPRGQQLQTYFQTSQAIMTTTCIWPGGRPLNRDPHPEPYWNDLAPAIWMWTGLLDPNKLIARI